MPPSSASGVPALRRGGPGTARCWGLLCLVQMASAGLATPTGPTGHDAGALSARKTPDSLSLMPVAACRGEPASISEQHLKDAWQAQVTFRDDAVARGTLKNNGSRARIGIGNRPYVCACACACACMCPRACVFQTIQGNRKKDHICKCEMCTCGECMFAHMLLYLSRYFLNLGLRFGESYRGVPANRIWERNLSQNFPVSSSVREWWTLGFLMHFILLFHTISARPPKQPRMVRTFLKVHTQQ